MAERSDTEKQDRQRKRRYAPGRHDAAIVAHQALPVTIGAFALFCALVPVSTTVINDRSIFNVDYTHEQIKFQLFAPGLDGAIVAAAVALGLLLALVLFRFLLSKRASTAFFSVGLSRTKLFATRFTTGVLCIIAAIVVPFAISFALNNAALGTYTGELEAFLFTAAGYSLVSITAFAICGFCIIRAGTLFESVAFSLALLAAVTVVLWGCGSIARYLLVGDAAGITQYGQSSYIEPSLLQSFSFANPLLFFEQAGSSAQMFKVSYPAYYPDPCDWTLHAWWLVVALSVCGADLWSFCRRQAEQAETAGKSSALSTVSVAVFGLAAFGVCLSILAPIDISVALFVGVAFFMLVSLVLLFGPMRGRSSGKRTVTYVVCELCVMVCVVAVIASGAFGFADYIPSADSVESVGISYNGSPSYLVDTFAGSSSGSSYYYTSTRTYTDSSAVDTVRSLQGRFIESARLQRATDRDCFENSVVPYDIVVRYTMRDGSECVRYYNQATIGDLDAMLALDDDAHSHVLENATITGDVSKLGDAEKSSVMSSPSYKAYQSGSIYAADGILNKILQVNCTSEDRQSLLRAIAEDVSNMDSNERYAPTSATKAVIMFTRSPDLDASSFGYSFSNALIYVNDSYPSTSAWLDTHGVMSQLGAQVDSRTVESLSLQLDDPYAGINKVASPVGRFFMSYRTTAAGKFWITQDFGAPITVTDQAHIADLLPRLRTGCYMTGGYLVQAKLRGISSYVYFYLPAANVPGYLS